MKKVIKPIGQPRQGRLFFLVPYAICGVILLLIPPLLPSHLQSIATKVLIFGIFALSLNILWGYTGLCSFGHAAYFGAAGYTVGILTVKYGIKSFWIAAPAGILVAVLVALVFGSIALRARGFYFVLVTMALAQLVFSVVWKWREMTGGTDGIAGIPQPDLGFPFFWNALTFYYFTSLIFVICVFLLFRFVNSPFGNALQGIRESESRMRTLGYNTWLYHYVSFVVAALFAGVAGVLFAYFNRLLVPQHAGAITSTYPLIIIVIGSGTLFWGPLIGAVVLVFSEYYFSLYLPERWLLILGAVFVISVVFLRGGIGIHLVKLWRKLGYKYGSIKG
jgi:branched-chain amino acid transport system permease protein